jgi:hypothetical protein
MNACFMRPRLLVAALALLASPARADMPYLQLVDRCDWWMSAADGTSHRMSIGLGDGDPVMTISDRAFVSFGEADRIALSFRFGEDEARIARSEGWVSSVVGEGQRMLGFHLSPAMRAAMDGAMTVEVMHEGRAIYALTFAGMPTRGELDACVSPPGRDSE